MPERLSTLDNSYFRRSDSLLAKTLDTVSPARGEKYLHSWQKRAVDVVLGGALAIASTPIIAAAAARKTLEDGHQPIYIQDRLIDGGSKFKIVKLRTMRPDADRMKVDPNSVPDPRVTKVGAFLRKHHIDEMPQLFQVVLGTLSLVGPRPRIDNTIKSFRKSWSEERFEVSSRGYRGTKKGVTGVDQVFGTGERENGSRFHFEQFYLKKASLGFDLYLVWKTFRKVIES